MSILVLFPLLSYVGSLHLHFLLFFYYYFLFQERAAKQLMYKGDRDINVIKSRPYITAGAARHYMSPSIMLDV